MNRTPLLLLSPALLLACQSREPQPRSEADLQDARAYAQDGNWRAARSALSDFEREDFDRLTQGDFSLLAGDVYYELGEYENAIDHYEDFLREQGGAEESRRAEERLLEMGLSLLEGNRKSLGIFSNRSAGERTLQNLAGWAPNSPISAEALARLGEYHLREREFEEAILDYGQILQFHPSSEWVDLATFRIGYVGWLRLDDHRVDGNLIRQPLNQLQRYLNDFPSGLYRADAEETVNALEAMLARHELALGDYYEDIENWRGARYHYHLATAWPDTEAGQEALERLQTLPPDQPLPEGGQD